MLGIGHSHWPVGEYRPREQGLRLRGRAILGPSHLMSVSIVQENKD